MPKLTPEAQEKMRRLLDAGHNHAEIGRALGVSGQTITNYATKPGWGQKRPGRKRLVRRVEPVEEPTRSEGMGGIVSLVRRAGRAYRDADTELLANTLERLSVASREHALRLRDGRARI